MSRMFGARDTKRVPIICSPVVVSGEMDCPPTVAPTPVSLAPLSNAACLKECLAGAVLDRVHASPGVTVPGIIGYLPPIHPDEVSGCLQQLCAAGLVEPLTPTPPIGRCWDPNPGLLSTPAPSPSSPGFTLTRHGLSLFSPRT
eukprot:Hpha_TRINITY_DN15133_c8_g4::TRINITY_DN15133_c8_g4_i1::g.127018::m.127018